MAFEVALKSRLVEAMILCLLNDETVAEYWGDRIWHMEPDIEDEFSNAPCIYLWNDPPRDRLNPKIGDFATPIFSVPVVLVEPTNKDPIPVGTGAIDSTSRREHVEKVLYAGDEEGDGEYNGKLFDPYDPTKFVNNIRPVFVQLTSKPWPLKGVTFYPIVATYGSNTTRTGRQKI